MSDNIFGDVISFYGSDDAVADGVQVDLTSKYPNDTALYKWPVRVTQRVWEKLEKTGDIAAHVYDLCYMSTKNPFRKKVDDYTVRFRCALPLGGREYDLKAQVNVRNQQGEPCIVIAFWDED